MQVLRPYILPIKGLKPGVHEYAFTVTDDFFAAFPDSPVSRASLELQVQVDRRHGEMEIFFDFAGTIATECDRCLAPIDLPVEGSEKLLVQFTSQEDLPSDDPQLVYVSQDANEFNLSTYAYEFMLLALPMIRTFECRQGPPPYPCDEELLDSIAKQQAAALDSSKSSDAPSPWDVLKSLKKD